MKKAIAKHYRSFLVQILMVLLATNQVATFLAVPATETTPQASTTLATDQITNASQANEPSDEELVVKMDSEVEAATEAVEDSPGQEELVIPATEESTLVTEEIAQEELAPAPTEAAAPEETVVLTPEEGAVTEEAAPDEAEATPNMQLFKLISETKKFAIPRLGTFIFTVDASITPAMLTPTAEITGKPEKSVLDLKVITFTNPVLTFSLATGLTLKATLASFGQELGEVALTLVLDRHGNFVRFSGTMAAEKIFKPFEKIPGANKIPGLKDIEIKQLQLNLDADKNIAFSGRSTILGVSSDVYIQITKEEESSKKSMPLLKAKPLTPLILTQLIPVLKGSPLEGLGFSDPQFIITAQDYSDAETGLSFSPGFSLAGTMQLSGPLFGNVRKLIPILPKEVFTLCTIGNEPQFMLRVADRFNLGGDTSLENIFLNIQARKQLPTGLRVEMGLKTNIKTKLPKEKEFTLFIGEVSIPLDPKLPTVVMKGIMQGKWNNVLGLKGISISDVAFELGASIATGFTPTSVGFAGTLDIGDKKAKMATKTSKDGEFVLYGKLDGEIGFTDVLSLAQATGLRIPKDKIPDFSLKNVEIKIAPRAASIGEFFFPKGTTLIGELTIKGCDFLKLDAGKTKAMLDVTIDDISIKGKGSISTISLANILKITGAGPDKKRGTADDGPMVELVLTPLEQSFVLSGDIILLGAQCSADVNLAPTNAYFTATLNLLPGLAAKARGEMIKAGALPDFKVTAEITTPSTLPFDKKDLEAGTKILEENRDNVKAEFQRKISALEDTIKARQKAMEANPAYKKLLSSLEDTKGKIRSVEQEVNKLESKVSGLDSEIRALERRLGVFNLFQTIDIDSVLLPQTLHLSFNNQITNNLFKEQLDPMKIDLRTYRQEYPLFCWGWFRRTFVQPVRRSVQQHIVEPVKKHVVEPVKNVVTTVVQKTGVEGLAEKVGGKDAIEKLKNAGYNVVKIASDPGKWDDAIKLAGLKAAREAARVACEAAKVPLKGLQASLHGLEESVKNFDPEILKLRAAQAVLTAKLGTEMAALEAAIVAFKTTTLAAFPAIKWLTPIEIKKLTITANLRGYATGTLPSISCDVKAFHAIDKTITFSADVKNIPDMLKRLVLKVFLLKS